MTADEFRRQQEEQFIRRKFNEEYEEGRRKLGLPEKWDSIRNYSDDLPIIRLPLGERARNCLSNGGYQTVGEIRCATDKELMRINNMGKKTLIEIRALLLGELTYRPKTRTEDRNKQMAAMWMSTLGLSRTHPDYVTIKMVGDKFGLKPGAAAAAMEKPLDRLRGELIRRYGGDGLSNYKYRELIRRFTGRYWQGGMAIND